MITKSDKKRVDAAISRHLDRLNEAEKTGPPGHILAAALDMLRAEVKIIERCLDDDGTGWGDEYTLEAALGIRSVAMKAGKEILDELK